MLEVHFLRTVVVILDRQNLPSIAADSAVPGLNRNLAYMNQQLIPKQSLTEMYDSYVEPIFRRRHQLEKESQRLTAQRDSLLPRLMSEEVRVQVGASRSTKEAST